MSYPWPFRQRKAKLEVTAGLTGIIPVMLDIWRQRDVRVRPTIRGPHFSVHEVVSAGERDNAWRAFTTFPSSLEYPCKLYLPPWVRKLGAFFHWTVTSEFGSGPNDFDLRFKLDSLYLTGSPFSLALGSEGVYQEELAWGTTADFSSLAGTVVDLSVEWRVPATSKVTNIYVRNMGVPGLGNLDEYRVWSGYPFDD